MKKSIHTILILFILIPIRVWPQSPSFAAAVHEYEDRMDQAARSWLKKDYGRSVDWFRSAHEVLFENKPSPSDAYSWGWCMALTSYTKLMERLVEIEIAEADEDSDLLSQLQKQARRWAETLTERMGEWDEVGGLDLNWIAIRSRWKKRFRPAIREAGRLPIPDSS